MTPPDWREEPIGKHHDRRSFDSGSPPLDRFLKDYARQSHERGGPKTFVAAGGSTVLGYYTLGIATVEFDRAPEFVRRGLGRYPLGGFRLARLAVDRRFQGIGLGSELLVSAGRRCLRVEPHVGGNFIVVDAKDDAAAVWYMRQGAVQSPDDPLMLFLSLAAIRDSIEQAMPR
jgi:GNAT superfamily N-acetyltransferase